MTTPEAKPPGPFPEPAPISRRPLVMDFSIVVYPTHIELVDELPGPNDWGVAPSPEEPK